MTRDMELVRAILLAIEKCVDDEPSSVRLNHLHCSPVVLSHHVRILSESGMIHAVEARHIEGTAWRPHSLTWTGHEFLALVRDEAVWQRVVSAARTTEGDVSFRVLSALAFREACTRAGLTGGCPMAPDLAEAANPRSAAA